MVRVWVWVKVRFRGSSRFVKYLNGLAVSLSGVVAIGIIPIARVTRQSRSEAQYKFLRK